MRRLFCLLAMAAVLALWAVKIILVDAPVLRLGFTALCQSKPLVHVRVKSVHFVRDHSEQEARLHMSLAGHGALGIRGTLGRYSVAMTGRAWKDIRIGLRLPAVRVSGRTRLLATAVSHAAFLQTVGGFADMILTLLLVWAFRSSMVIRPGLGGEGVGCVALLVVAALPIIRELVAFLFFPMAAGGGWFGGWRPYLWEACLSAAAALLFPALVLAAAFFLPKFETSNQDDDEFAGPAGSV